MAAPVRHLTADELAARLRCSTETLKDWRRDGRGPSYISDGRKFVRYPLAAVEAWEQSRLVTASESA
jgi:predicted DNA-binding transcriptional regulator AlpA